jgi:hypothetical protein
MKGKLSIIACNIYINKPQNERSLMYGTMETSDPVVGFSIKLICIT